MDLRIMIVTVSIDPLLITSYVSLFLLFEGVMTVYAAHFFFCKHLFVYNFVYYIFMLKVYISILTC